MGSNAKAGKTKRKGTCAYCARADVSIEEEHVFPNSWYPDGFPQQSMLRVPACRQCNGDYGRIEERMFLPLVGGLPDSDPAYRGIIARALRGVDPNAGRGVRDIAHRNARRQSIVRRFELADQDGIGSASVWTPATHDADTIRTPGGLLVRGVPAIRFDPHDITQLGIKFLKGCYFSEKGAPLRSDAVCDARTFSTDPSDALQGASKRLHLNQRGSWPFQFSYSRAQEDDAVTMWWFLLWGHIVIVAWSSSPEYESAQPEGA